MCNTTMTPLFGEHRKQNKIHPQDSRVRLSARITPIAYDAIIELQCRHRKKTDKALRLWEILDAAVITYAKANGIKIRT